MSPLGTAHAGYQIRLLQGSDKLLKVFNRNILAFGYLADLDRALVLMAGQID
jgi:hypothetical protein